MLDKFRSVFRDNAEQQQTSKEMMNENRVDGIDIVFENIRYSVDVPDQTAKSSLPFKKATKKR